MTRIIDTFTEKVRVYVVDRLMAKFAKTHTKEVSSKSKEFLDFANGSASRKIPHNIELWDIGILVSLFYVHEPVFKDDFGGDARHVFPRLIQIKDMRNRRVHEISRTLPISARETYNVAEACAKFFELMSIEVPQDFHRDFR